MCCAQKKLTSISENDDDNAHDTASTNTREEELRNQISELQNRNAELEQ